MKSNARKLFTVTALILLFSFVIPMVPQALAADKNIHGFTVFTRGAENKLRGIKKKYVSVKDLADLLGFDYSNLKGGKAAMIGHLYYDKKVIPYNGEAWVEASTFFKFFNVPFRKTNDWTYDLQKTYIPMFTDMAIKLYSNSTVKIAGATMKMDVAVISGRKYIEVDSFKDTVKATTKVAGGKLTLNGKVVDHWVDINGKTFALDKDLAKTSGKSVK